MTNSNIIKIGLQYKGYEANGLFGFIYPCSDFTLIFVTPHLINVRCPFSLAAGPDASKLDSTRISFVSSMSITFRYENHIGVLKAIHFC